MEGLNGSANEQHEEPQHESTLEALVAQKAREIAEREARTVVGNYLQVLQTLLDQMKDAAVQITGPLVTTDDEYISLSRAAKKLGTYENTIRRAVAMKRLTVVHRKSTSMHKKGLVMMVAVRDLERWWSQVHPSA